VKNPKFVPFHWGYCWVNKLLCLSFWFCVCVLKLYFL